MSAFSAGNSLRRMRTIHRVLLVALILLGRSVMLVSDVIEPRVSGTTATIAVGLCSAWSLIYWKFADLSLTDDGTLLMYKNRFIVRMSFANAPALLGLGGAVFSGSAWPFFVSLPFLVFGHLKAAPSQANIERDQEQLRRDGYDVNLLALLLGHEDGNSF